MFLKNFTSYLLKLIFALAISNVLTVSNTLASQCEVIYPNQATQITTHLKSVCVTFNSLNVDKTYLVLDKSYSNNATYDAVVKDATDKTFIHHQVSNSGTISMSKLNPGIYDESTIHLYPITDEKNTHFQ